MSATDPLAERRAYVARQRRLAVDLDRRLTAVERALAADPGLRDRGAAAIIAEAAVRLVEEMNRRGDAHPAIVPQKLTHLSSARLVLSRLADHDKASAVLAESLRLHKAGREGEAFAALYGTPLR